MAGKYQAYPEYKNSGVNLIGDIPDHWRAVRLKYVTPNVTVGVVVNPSTYFENDGTVPFLRGLDVNRDEIALENVKRISEKSNGINSKSTLREGDLVSIRVGYPGVTAVIPKELDGANCASLLIIKKPKTIGSRLLCYQINTDIGRNQVKLLQQGAAQEQINVSDIVDFWVTCPPEKEAIIIEKFLDHETAKIDTLIEKQQQLIKLLKEKRQAVISHAVTKGLNPNAPMRDSGVEWLGEVPEHWDACLIKYKCIEITDGSHISPVTEDGEHYFVSIKDIRKGVIDFDNSLLTTPESYDYLVKTGCMPFPGDILFSKDGTIGQTAITPENIEFVVASSLIIIRPNKKQVLPNYFDYLLQSEIVKEQVESFVKGAALRRLSIQNLLKVWGVFPPVDEQDDIVAYLSNKLQRYDVLEAEAVKFVELLKERRTALISAAVTGKINVRDWKVPEQNQTNKEVAT